MSIVSHGHNVPAHISMHGIENNARYMEKEVMGMPDISITVYCNYCGEMLECEDKIETDKWG